MTHLNLHDQPWNLEALIQPKLSDKSKQHRVIFYVVLQMPLSNVTYSRVQTFYVWVVPGIDPTTLALQVKGSTN